VTGDAMFIATLSNPPNAGDAQELSVRAARPWSPTTATASPQPLGAARHGAVSLRQVWEWAVDSEKPRATTSVASADVQTMVRFNPTNASQLVSNGMNRVIFWSTQVRDRWPRGSAQTNAQTNAQQPSRAGALCDGCARLGVTCATAARGCARPLLGCAALRAVCGGVWHACVRGSAAVGRPCVAAAATAGRHDQVLLAADLEA
jgi:hypothetical protein